MINLNSLSPFLRFAMYSKLNGPFCLQRRTIFDYELILIADGEFCLSYDDNTFKCEKIPLFFYVQDTVISLIY